MTSVCPTADTDSVIHRAVVPERERPGVWVHRASRAERREPANVIASVTIAEDSHRVVGEIVGLLHQASERTWQDAATESPRVSLGLGIYLAHAQASVLLPVDYQIPLVVVDERTVVQLLRDAEHRTRTLPLHRPEMAGISELAVALCDLVREASHLEC